ncbi:MAG: 50S ribosomal protein L1 [Patescibacteria group bacterium]
MSKRMIAAIAKVEKNKIYSLDEAIQLVKDTSTVKFDASVEIHVHTGIDVKKSDQQIRATVALPHGTGKTKKVAAFVNADKRKEAEEAGADVLYGEEDIAIIKETGKFDFEVAVATPDMMPKLAVIARILGPRGLMPSPKTNTVTEKVGDAIRALKKGTITFKTDDTANVHTVVGKVSFTNEQLKENTQTFMEALRRAKPASTKGIFLKTITLTASMGPGIKLAL